MGFGGTPERLELPSDVAELEAALEAVPNTAAVFLLWPREGEPYLARTGLLRRRLGRLLRRHSGASRLLNLSGVATQLEYWPAASRLESSLVLWEQARLHYPERYLSFLKLRFPSWVQLVFSNEFPRTRITTRLGSGGRDLYYGPFRSRAAAEAFEHSFLDLFQLRRCQEDLEPKTDHPGCIYGEMNMCLRPCQQVVSADEYASEAARVAEFLRTSGRALTETAAHARDRASERLEFEEAARHHKRLEKIEASLDLRETLTAPVENLHGVAVTPAAGEGHVRLWFLHRGWWQAPVDFDTRAASDKPVSLDHRLKEVVSGLNAENGAARDRQEHLALLARWVYSSWRDGEWIGFESPEKISWRKLVGAVARVAAGKERS